ncbi:HesA/MoeB/ThiF family protein [Massilia timonae]|nr:ThiF family adenylyltransferase [Massilia timonae]
MTSPFDHFLKSHPLLLAETRTAGTRSERKFALALPAMPAERAFAGAWLVLPANFPEARARIQLSKDAVLRVPHIDSAADLCFSGDAGPASGASMEERVGAMLYLFEQEFLLPWLSGRLDGDFERETANYWSINVSRAASEVDAIKRVYTFAVRHSEPRVLTARLVQPSRALIVNDDEALASRFVASLGPRATEVSNAVVADVPIDYPYTPATWPTTLADVSLLLEGRLTAAQYRQFEQIAKRRTLHRVVLLRAPTCTYAFLLPGGPPTRVVKHKTKRAYPTLRLLPLGVERMDPSWTCGRAQHPQVLDRQQSHVLVLGAGSLGSAVIDLLARSGVGKITIVDPDYLSSPNIGRHLLGADMLGYPKAKSVAAHVGRSVPSCQLSGTSESAEAWLQRSTLAEVTVVLDFTGEPEVRSALESARLAHPRHLLIGWFEPYVAAAHACVLKDTDYWLNGLPDRLMGYQAVDWPDTVIHNEPGCSSQFQSYTPVQANYGIALVAEAALQLIDGDVSSSYVRSWVRGQRFLDAQLPGLKLRDWAQSAAEQDGVLIERRWS